MPCSYGEVLEWVVKFVEIAAIEGRWQTWVVGCWNGSAGGVETVESQANRVRVKEVEHEQMLTQMK